MGKKLPETCWADLGDQWSVIVASSWFFYITLPTEKDILWVVPGEEYVYLATDDLFGS